MNSHGDSGHRAEDTIKLQREIEAMRIFELILALPTEKRERWLAGKTLDTTTAQRVHALLKAAADTGTFLESPALLATCCWPPPLR